MRLLRGHDAEVTHWVCERIPHLAKRVAYFDKGCVLGPTRAFGVLDDGGALIAGVVFHGYDPFVRAIEVSCAAITPKWGNREMFRSIMRYPFEHADCQRCTAVTPRRAEPGATSPRKFLEGLGFVREGSIRRGFGDQNAIVYGLLAEDWANGRFCRQRGALSGGEKITEHHPSSRSESHCSSAV